MRIGAGRSKKIEKTREKQPYLALFRFTSFAVFRMMINESRA
jgi:hypothetical protein